MIKVGNKETMGESLVAGESDAGSTSVAHCIVVYCIYAETNSVEPVHFDEPLGNSGGLALIAMREYVSMSFVIFHGLFTYLTKPLLGSFPVKKLKLSSSAWPA